MIHTDVESKMKSDCPRCAQLGENIMCNVCAANDPYDARAVVANIRKDMSSQLRRNRQWLATQLEELVKEPGSRVHLGTTVRELILTLKE